MNGWTANAERYLAEWYGETIYDQEPERIYVQHSLTAERREKGECEMYELTSEQQAKAFSREIFVVGADMSLGEFLTRLAEYGDARVREALAQRAEEATR